jgi:hypothetical protein
LQSPGRTLIASGEERLIFFMDTSPAKPGRTTLLRQPQLAPPKVGLRTGQPALSPAEQERLLQAGLIWANTADGSAKGAKSGPSRLSGFFVARICKTRK